jgi:hypothetical protein
MSNETNGAMLQLQAAKKDGADGQRDLRAAATGLFRVNAVRRAALIRAAGLPRPEAEGLMKETNAQIVQATREVLEACKHPSLPAADGNDRVEKVVKHAQSLIDAGNNGDAQAFFQLLGSIAQSDKSRESKFTTMETLVSYPAGILAQMAGKQE